MSTLIIGGGWSGLAAAIRLTQHGQPVHLIESAKQLGGRARNVQWGNITVDNGQHLMIGAYDHMLALIDILGLKEQDIFTRLPIDITLHDTHYPPLSLSAKRKLPWPLSIAWQLFQSVGIKDLYAITRLQRSIPTQLNQPDITVAAWLAHTKQSPRLIKQLWEPLCLASLNTPINLASAHIMATVLQDSLGKGRAASDLLIPKVPLAAVFANAAAAYIQQRGGTISLQTRAQHLIINAGKIQGVQCKDGSTLNADNVIIACNPSHTTHLLGNISPFTPPIENPICTLYLQYPPHTRLGKPMLGMTGTLSQWIFDRSNQTQGLMAIVISAQGKHEQMDNPELVKHVSQEVHQCFQHMPEIANDALVIREKRATFASTVNIESQRPVCQTEIQGLFLAGDYVANGYPATLEGAIRNGEAAADSAYEGKQP